MVLRTTSLAALTGIPICSALSVSRESFLRKSSGLSPYAADYTAECQDALAGSACYKAVLWLQTKGLEKHPDWYPQIDARASFREVQGVLHSISKADCPKPCMDGITRTDRTDDNKDVMKLIGDGRQVASKSKTLSEPEQCEDAKKGDWCYTSMMWLKEKGISKHPDWYPTLSPASSNFKIQAELNRQGRADCPRPCGGPVRKAQKEAKMVQQEVRKSSRRLMSECEDARPNTTCYTAVSYGLAEGLRKYPAFYPGLDLTATFKDVQESLYLNGHGECNARPCPKVPTETNVVEHKHEMRLEDMSADQLNKYIKGDWDGVPTTSFELAAADQETSTFAMRGTTTTRIEAYFATTTQEPSTSPLDADASLIAANAGANSSNQRLRSASSVNSSAELERDVYNLSVSSAEVDEDAEASADERAAESNASEPTDAEFAEWAAQLSGSADAARELEDASDAVNSSEAEREAIEADKLKERAEMVLDGYPAYPGCFVRLPTGCTNHHRKSHLWRHDMWAEQGKNLTGSDCKLRRRYWNEFCGIDDAKVLHIAPPEGEGARHEDYANEEKKGWVIDGYPHHHGCYMRMPSGCKKHFKKSHLWRHDVWAEERNVNASQCGERRGFWNDFCGVSDAKVVFKDVPAHVVVVEENATAMRNSSEQADEATVPNTIATEAEATVTNATATEAEATVTDDSSVVDPEGLPRIDDEAQEAEDLAMLIAAKANASSWEDEPQQSNETAEELQQSNETSEGNSTASEDEASTTAETQQANTAHQETEQEMEDRLRNELKMKKATTTAPPHEETVEEMEKRLRAQLMADMATTTTAPPLAETAEEMARRIRAQLMADMATTTTAPPLAETVEEMVRRIRAQLQADMAITTTTPPLAKTMEEMIRAQLKAEMAITTTAPPLAETPEEMRARLRAELLREMLGEVKAKKA